MGFIFTVNIIILNLSNSQYYENTDEMLIRILHPFWKRSTNIIIDNKNPMDLLFPLYFCFFSFDDIPSAMNICIISYNHIKQPLLLLDFSEKEKPKKNFDLVNF